MILIWRASKRATDRAPWAAHLCEPSLPTSDREGPALRPPRGASISQPVGFLAHLCALSRSLARTLPSPRLASVRVAGCAAARLRISLPATGWLAGCAARSLARRVQEIARARVKQGRAAEMSELRANAHTFPSGHCDKSAHSAATSR